MAETARTGDRRSRVHDSRQPRHRSASESEKFGASFTALGELAYGGASVSANAIDLRTGRVLLSIDDRLVLPTAGIGRLLLLIEVSARLTERDASGYGILDKTSRDAVGQAGIWQHLQAPALPVTDLATLVAATGDNLATNVLLRQVGLDAVRARSEALGLVRMALLDFARDSRGPDDAPQLSVGSTAELARLLFALGRGEVIDAPTSERVTDWLSHNADLSLVASAFGRGHPVRRRCSAGRRILARLCRDGAVRRCRSADAAEGARRTAHRGERSARVRALIASVPSGSPGSPGSPRGPHRPGPHPLPNSCSQAEVSPACGSSMASSACTP